MSHQEKQRIFDEYASQFEEFGNFEGMIDALLSTTIHKEELIYRIFECCDLVQSEQQKRIAENARIKIIYAEKDDLIDTPIELGPVVDKNTITDPKNIIK